MSTCLAPTISAPAVSPVAEACGRIPPLWPLEDFVAVNPFLGFAALPFEQAATVLERTSHHGILMDAEWYRERLDSGEIPAESIAFALAPCRMHAGVDPAAWLRDNLRAEGRAERLLTAAASLDLDTGSDWSSFITGEISKWCSSYFDRGQAAWSMPFRSLPLYAAWKSAAAHDLAPEAAGLRGFRRFLASLPDSAPAAIDYCLGLLDVPAVETVDLLHCQLLSVYGWSAWAAGAERSGAMPGAMADLLAIRLAYDASLIELGASWSCRKGDSVPGAFSPARYIAQCALESAMRLRVARSLNPPAPDTAEERKQLHAVFCIDVRSEPLRRALEAQSSGIQTIGFAGFFGLAVAFDGSARCPVLLQPSIEAASAHTPSAAQRFRRMLSESWRTLTSSATACFPAVEVGGATALWSLARHSLRDSAAYPPAAPLLSDIPLARLIELAGSALANMGLAPERLAPIVLFCGHGSLSQNNPYEAALDCGACGGHKGDVNARLLASICNQPAVRAALGIPADTVFLAGVHITTTDEFVLYSEGASLSESARAGLRTWLEAASAQARQERAARVLGPVSSASDPLPALSARAASWSETRPEWGLAGNAAFIAAPRSRTRGVNLQGRAFLHDYDAALDSDGAVLHLILTAPVVVASWINLQYYGSVVHNSLYGSGDKVLHNVVGRFGVWEGNGGDLRFGLPLQSLHDGKSWRHEPLRLQVFVEAHRTRIDKVLRASADIGNLVANSWLHVIAIEDGFFYLCRRPGDWEFLAVEELRPREFSLPADGPFLSCAG